MVVRARGSQMRLKLVLPCQRYPCLTVVRARGSQMRLKLIRARSALTGIACGKGAGFSDEIETDRIVRIMGGQQAPW